MRDEDKAAVQKLFLEHIGKVIKWRRNHLGVSQEVLGEFLGVKQATVARYEKGQGSIPASYLPLISGRLLFDMKEFVPPELPEHISRQFQEIVERCRYEKLLSRAKRYMSKHPGMPDNAIGFMTTFSYTTPRPFSDEEFDEYMGSKARSRDREVIRYAAALINSILEDDVQPSDLNIARDIADYAISRLLERNPNAEARILTYCVEIMASQGAKSRE